MPWTVQWPAAQADKAPVLAAFLIGRGPAAFVGYGWSGGGSIHVPPWEPMWDAYEVGEPAGLCQEGAQGVFSREWTKGKATLDCNTWQATLDF